MVVTLCSVALQGGQFSVRSLVVFSTLYTFYTFLYLYALITHNLTQSFFVYFVHYALFSRLRSFLQRKSVAQRSATGGVFFLFFVVSFFRQKLVIFYTFYPFYIFSASLPKQVNRYIFDGCKSFCSILVFPQKSLYLCKIVEVWGEVCVWFVYQCVTRICFSEGVVFL